MDYANRSKREKELVAALLLLFDDESLRLSPSTLELRLRTTLAEHYAAVYTEAATQLAGDKLSPEQMADIANRAAKWAEQQAAAAARDFMENTKSAMAGDLTPEEIDQLFGEGRAENLAITETTRAATEGMEFTAAELLAVGLLLGKAIWITAEDSKVCPICRPLNGRERSFWSRFAISGPPAHPRCRCWLQYS